MDKINKLSLPAVILIGSVILGGFYFASQVIKQGSIEKQQQIKIEQEKQEQVSKELKEQEAKAETEQALLEIKLTRQFCINEAKDVLKARAIIDDEFCAMCDEYADSSPLKSQCLDGCLELVVNSNDQYEEDEETCFRRYP